MFETKPTVDEQNELAVPSLPAFLKRAARNHEYLTDTQAETGDDANVLER